MLSGSMLSLRTIEAHAGGGSLRLVVEGMPAPRGKTMQARGDWMARHADHLRRMLVLEPRGHRDLTAALLTEPVSDAAHAGLIFMNASGYPPVSGHGVMAATTIALERGLLLPGGDGRTVTFDTGAGQVTARAVMDATGRRVEQVSVLGLPSFVLRAGMPLRIEGRQTRVDVAFGGAFYAVIDAESVGLGVETAHLAALRRVGRAAADAVHASLAIEHPVGGPSALHGTVFTAPPHGADAHLRLVVVLARGEAGRSPSGTGMSAVMAVLDAMGLLGEDDQQIVAEGLVDTRFTGRVAGRTLLGAAEIDAIVPRIDGSAWITGEQLLVADEADPLMQGTIV
jgi:proline racemase